MCRVNTDQWVILPIRGGAYAESEFLVGKTSLKAKLKLKKWIIFAILKIMSRIVQKFWLRDTFQKTCTLLKISIPEITSKV